jgi:hypothetical protein
VRQEVFVLDQLGRHPLQDLLDRLVEAGREVLAQAADADVAGEHPEAGDEFIDVEQQLPLAEAVEHHRDGAHLHRVRGQPNQVAVEALQFRQQHADPLHAVGDLDTEQLLDRERKAEAVRLGAQVIHPLDERDDLLPLLLLGRLLDAGVEVADGGIGGDDVLAVQLEDDPKHPVRARVLRPHVDGERFGLQFRHAGRQNVLRLASCVVLHRVKRFASCVQRPRSTHDAGRMTVA